MAKNIQSLQLLRNTSKLYATRDAALTELTGGTIPGGNQDGTPVLARYKGTDGKIYTLVGYYADSSAISSVDSAASHMTVFDIEGSAADVKKLENMIGTGVTTTNTVTKQLQDLSGTTSDTSETTSVAGAKKYAEVKVTEAINGLNATITADTGYYINKVDEVNGKISGTTAALPTVNAIGEAGKPITAVSENLGAVSAATGTINAEYVNVTGSVFTSSTVKAALEEIDTEYKAADAAIVDNASSTANTLAKLEDIVNKLSADAKEYSIKKITEGLSTNVKEAWGLFDAGNNQSGATINIYKDSALQNIYLGHVDDRLANADEQGESVDTTITSGTGDAALVYVMQLSNSKYKLTAVNVESFLSESEFADGLQVKNHVVSVKVDTSSEQVTTGDNATVDVLTVGSNGVKVSNVQNAINYAISKLDANVTGGDITSKHVQVIVDEVDGKLTAVTVNEANIADADKLVDLSGKTVTEVASSNGSIEATLSDATDKTKHLDIITDASKIKMTGFTKADALTKITESSSVTEAFKEVDKVITGKAEVISNALNDLETTKAEKTALTAEIKARKDVDGVDGDAYIADTNARYINGASSLYGADQALDRALKAVDDAMLTGVVAGNGITVLDNGNKSQTISVKVKNDDGIVNDETGLHLGTIDCGTY